MTPAGAAVLDPLEAADALERREPRQRTILLATDLSSASTFAETEGITLARDLRSSLVVLSVIDPKSPRSGRGEWLQRMDQARSALEDRSRNLMARARAEGVPVRLLIWAGDPAESIVDAAVAESAAYIVVGSHGRHGMDRMVQGSISDQVIRNATVPVVVARQREEAG